MRPFLAVVPALLLAAVGAADTPARNELYSVSFEKPEVTNDFVFSDPAVWKYGKDKNGDGCLELAYDRKAYKSTYVPKHRSPVHIALIAGKSFGSFILDCELQSTTEPYGHQDMCVFFGFESPEKYYYVHFAKEADMNAHNIFIVNGAARKNIAKETTKGIEWKKDTWHKVRIFRDHNGGKIEVLFDGKKIMTAEDKTFGAGHIGFGSFDDTGRVRHIMVSGASAADKKVTFFKPLGKTP
ncbi:MAG: hypothetical protein FJ304_12035 [Planctomycetes bacterium]|nr:hypothetical protein [Planctomycetota bacterium]